MLLVEPTKDTKLQIESNQDVQGHHDPKLEILLMHQTEMDVSQSKPPLEAVYQCFAGCLCCNRNIIKTHNFSQTAVNKLTQLSMLLSYRREAPFLTGDQIFIESKLER